MDGSRFPDLAPQQMTHRAISPGFFREHQVRRILQLAGYMPRFGWPSPGEAMVVWGRKPWSQPGRLIAARTRVPLITIEDGFLRSITANGRSDPPLSLMIDLEGVHYDPTHPSKIETLIASGAGRSPELLRRAKMGIALLQSAGLSKYNLKPRGTAEVPEPGYVLVIDQLIGDASVTFGSDGPASFRHMLDTARQIARGRQIVVKTHPATDGTAARGHFDDLTPEPRITLVSEPINSWDLIEHADDILTVSSQLGYEALLAGKQVHVFGQPFYAGWGLSHDRANPPSRRTARPSKEEIFACSHLLAPVYYDPWADRLTDFEGAVRVFSFLAARQWQQTSEAATGEVFLGFRPWKRRNCLRFGPAMPRPAVFAESPAKAFDAAHRQGRDLWVWAGKYPPEIIRSATERGIRAGQVEDGFLRSIGLGAKLVDASSLIFDRVGIHYDPSRPSRLEQLITQAAELAPDAPQIRRARKLAEQIITSGVSKYNTGSTYQTRLPDRHIVLVVGQVEDDASVRLGTSRTNTNLALVHAARAAHQSAYLIYKPHPDVEAGRRAGHIPKARLSGLVDSIAHDVDACSALDSADEVWTMTSLMGFEALLRRKTVVCVGAPFYAGWGLTQDLGLTPNRRRARPSLDALVWAALIAYPNYLDPISGYPCQPELVVKRLADRQVAQTRSAWRMADWFHGLFTRTQTALKR